MVITYFDGPEGRRHTTLQRRVSQNERSDDPGRVLQAAHEGMYRHFR